MDTNRFRNRTNYSAPQRRYPTYKSQNPGRKNDSKYPTMPDAPNASVSQQQQQYQQSLDETDYRPTQARYPSIDSDNYNQVKEASNSQDSENIDLNEPWKGGWLDSIAPNQNSQSVNNGPEVAEMSQNLPAASTNISIQINMPKLHWPKIKLPELPYKKIAIWVAIGVITLTVAVTAIFAVKHFFFKPKPVVSMDSLQGDAAYLSNPTFKPIAPKSKPTLGQGNSQATSFDGKLDSYSFTDSLDGVPLTVSQQPIPATFSSATEALASVAKSMNAKTVIPTSLGSPAYEAYDANTSTQSLIFTINNLLIFIQSNFQHSNSQWTNYIDSLI